MLRTLLLLVATLAAVSLAAPASKRDSHSWSFNFGFGSASKTSSFKATSGGHRRHDHRDPRAEIARVYSKYHWSITLPWSGTTVDFEFPDSSDQGGDSSSSSSDGSDGSYGGTYGSPSDSSSDSSPVGAPETTAVSSFVTVSQTSDAVAATSPDSYATQSYAPAEPSSSPVDATSAPSYGSPQTSAAASPSAAPQTGGGGGETGEVTATPEENESEYLSPVIIGGQKLNLNFDTGSADLWVFSTSLSSSQLGDHAAYDPTKSSTWEEYPDGSWEIGYGDGSGASGTVGFDTVDVGGATATRQAVELATVVSSEFVSDENNDGLLGLAFGSINTVQPKQQQSFFENIADQLDEKLFTADLDEDASGTYEFGKLDSSKYQGELHTTPIDNSRGFWEFPSNTYSIGGKDTQNYNASPAIADTGTSLMMVDDAVAEAYYAQIQGASMNDQAGGYTYPCDADIPSFGVAIGNDGFIATLNGTDIEYAKIGGNTCFGGIQGNSGQGLQIYGAVLLKQYFAVFNFGDLTFGLAQKN